MGISDDFEHLEITDADRLWTWLDTHHGQADSIWLVTWKAAHRDRYVSREAVLDALVAYGWIDGIRRKVDEDRTKQLVSPRKQQVWADTYKQRAERLESEGRMMDAGRATIAEAKAAGLWDALAHVDALDVPEDLEAALGSGADWFHDAAPSYRRNVLRWIAGAKKPETRAKRIAILADHAQRGIKVANY